MRVDREIMVRGLADFNCPTDSDHTFEYIIDRKDNDGYVWLFAMCNQCPADARFWFVAAESVADQLFGTDMVEDLLWRQQVSELISEGVVNDTLAAISRGTWVAMMVELAKRVDRAELHQLLEVPDTQPLLGWAHSLVDQLDREGMERFLLLYALEVEGD